MSKRKRKKYNDNGITQISVKPPVMRPSVVESDVAVPVLWSFLLAGSLGLVATLAAAALRAALDTRWEWWLPLAVGGCVGVLVFAWRCTICEGDRRALLLYPLEVATGMDIDQDGYIGEPQVEVEPVAQDPRLIYVHDPYKEQHDRGAADFRHFLRGAYDKKGTTWRAWDNAPLPSGKALSRPVWEMWTGRLVQSGLATRDYPTAPLVLTGDYRQALDTLRSVL